MDRYVRSFASPDEVIDLATVRSALITNGGLTATIDEFSAVPGSEPVIRPNGLLDL